VSDIIPDSEITDAYQSIANEKYLGAQYDWLARYCKQNEIDDIQLCIHLDDKAHFVLERYIREINNDSQVVFQVDQKYKNGSEYAVFRFFSLPIFNLSKIQMVDITKRQNWETIMNMTWFCHNPKNKLPCGICKPCLYTMEEGLGWRIPKNRRMMSLLRRKVIWPTKAFMKVT
jgi:hypothetical protein